MKKTLLSALALALAFSMPAQFVKDHLTKTGAFDDFKDGDKYTDGNNDYSHPVIVDGDTTGYRGLFWTEATGDINGFMATKTRTGSAINYVVTQTEGAYEPFLAVFGEIEGVKNVIDLTTDANVSFTVTNKGTKTIRFSVQLQDINGTSLAYLPGVIGDEANFYLYNIGYVQGETTAIAPEDLNSTVPVHIQNFSLDFKTAVVGCPNNVVGGQAGCTTAFDYSQVTGITFTVVDNENTAGDPGTGPATCANYCPLAITDYPVSISNFKMGDQTTLAISKSKEQVSFSAFPNPVTGNTVNFSKEISNVTVYDFTGNVVATQASATSFNTNNLKAGIYMISADQGSLKVVVE